MSEDLYLLPGADSNKAINRKVMFNYMKKAIEENKFFTEDFNDLPPIEKEFVKSLSFGMWSLPLVTRKTFANGAVINVEHTTVFERQLLICDLMLVGFDVSYQNDSTIIIVEPFHSNESILESTCSELSDAEPEMTEDDQEKQEQMVKNNETKVDCTDCGCDDKNETKVDCTDCGCDDDKNEAYHVQNQHYKVLPRNDETRAKLNIKEDGTWFDMKVADVLFLESIDNVYVYDMHNAHRRREATKEQYLDHMEAIE